MPISGEVRINGVQVFGHNEKPPETLKCQPPVIYQPREVGVATQRTPKPNSKYSGQRPQKPKGKPGAPATGKNAVARKRAALAHQWATHKPEYNQWAHEHGKDRTDCGVFIGRVMRESGSDPDYPAGSTGVQWAYVTDPQNGWTTGQIGDGNGPQPGDVLLRHPYRRESGHIYGHTGLYISQHEGANGVMHDVTDEASLGTHGPKETSNYTDSSLAHTYQIWARPPGGK